jgi:hypothetical protein
MMVGYTKEKKKKQKEIERPLTSTDPKNKPS